MRTLLWSALLLCAWPAVPQAAAGLIGERSQASQQLSLAANHFLLGENHKALETYRKARELLAASDQLGQGLTWKGEADVLFRLGDDDEALDAYHHARELFKASGDQLGQGDTWRGEARILDQLGDAKEAREACEAARQLFRNAREIFLTSGEQPRLGDTWYGEAEILYRLSEKDTALATQALYHYEWARHRYHAAGDKRGEGNTWRGEGDVRLRLGEYKKALDTYGKARQIFRAVGDHEGQGDTWFGEAQVWKSMGDNLAISDPGAVAKPGKAKQAATNLAPYLGKAKKAAAAAITEYQNAGAVSKQMTAVLLKASVAAAAAYTRVVMGPLPLINVGPFSVGISFQKKVRKARPDTRSSEEAIRLHGQWRETGTTDEDRTKLEQEISEAYDFLVSLRAHQRGKAAEALRLTEEARSRVLLDLLATPPSFGALTSPADLKAERQRLGAEISQIEEQLRGTPALEQQEELRVQRLQLELKWNAALKKSFPQEPPLDTIAIQALARETGPLLVYYTTDSEVWGFLILPDTTEIYKRSLKIARDELAQTIDTFNYDLLNLSERQADAQALRLWNLLIDPFIEHLPKSGPLVLVPHGPLHGLPFEALRDAGGKQLFERWQISIAPSVSALAFARSRHVAPSPGDSFLGFVSGQGLNLPPDEVDKVSRFFGTSRAAVANYHNYKEFVAAARHLLISTRGEQSDRSRRKTYLEIEPTPDHDSSRLTAAEIATIPLKAELVTLAACDTSSGKALPSDERLNVTRSFLIAGADAVLATRWKLPEEAATSRFLADFYQAYRRGGPQGTGMRKDEALTEARRLSRERGDPAQVWAAWVLVGDAR